VEKQFSKEDRLSKGFLKINNNSKAMWKLKFQEWGPSLQKNN
jgi:hypothetical protein